MKNNQKKGISLIVLVITIIVMLVLAAAIILSVSSGKVISKSSWAKLSSDRASLQSEYSVILTDMLNDGTDGHVYSGLSIEDVRNNEKFIEWCKKVEAAGSQFTVYGDDELEVTKPSEIEVRVKLTNKEVTEYGLTIAEGRVKNYDWIQLKVTNPYDSNDYDVAYVYNNGNWEERIIENGEYAEGEFGAKFYNQEDEMIDLTALGLKNANAYHMVIEGNGTISSSSDIENMIVAEWQKPALEWFIDMQTNGSSTKDPGIYPYITKVIVCDGIENIPDEFFTLSFIEEVVIPDSVKSIGDRAFDTCEKLKYVTIPSSVTSIGKSAFGECTSLTDLVIPGSVKIIGDGAFEVCTSLKNVTIQDGVTSIGTDAFYFCTSLESITIPNSVTKIDVGAFDQCDSLEKITLPNKLEVIEQYTFYDCPNLKYISIPKSLKKVVSGAFVDTNLTDVYYEGTEEEWNKIVFEDNQLDEFSSATIHYNSKIY